MNIKEHPMYQQVQEVKTAFAEKRITNAIIGWCKIYDYFENKMKVGEDNHKVFEEQNEVMRLFTNEEVYGITDAYKRSKGY